MPLDRGTAEIRRLPPVTATPMAAVSSARIAGWPTNPLRTPKAQAGEPAPNPAAAADGDSPSRVPTRQGWAHLAQQSQAVGVEQPNQIVPATAESALQQPRQINLTAYIAQQDDEDAVPSASDEEVGSPSDQPPALVEQPEPLAPTSCPPKCDVWPTDACSGCDVCPTDASGGCDEDICLDGCSDPIWVFGSEVTFMSPDLNSGDVSYFIDDFTVPATYNYLVDDLDSFIAAPRLWAGVQGECWGVVARYWQLADGQTGHDPYTIPIPAADRGYVANSQVDAYTLDLEANRVFWLNDAKMTFAFGARYAEFEHDQSVLAFARITDDLLTGSARSHRVARGTGITAAIGGRKPLFCNSCLHLFFNVRGSVLWGSADTQVATSAQLMDLFGAGGSFNDAATTWDDDIFIGELQLGVEWDYQLKWLPASAFFRVAGEYQFWEAGNGYAFSQSYADDVGVVQSTATSVADGLMMNLYGITVGAGFTW